MFYNLFQSKLIILDKNCLYREKYSKKINSHVICNLPMAHKGNTMNYGSLYSELNFKEKTFMCQFCHSFWSTRPTHSHAGCDHCFHKWCPCVRASVRTSVPTFQNLSKQNKFQVKTMFISGETVGLAGWIIDDSCLVSFQFIVGFQMMKEKDRRMANLCICAVRILNEISFHFLVSGNTKQFLIFFRLKTTLYKRYLAFTSLYVYFITAYHMSDNYFQTFVALSTT